MNKVMAFLKGMKEYRSDYTQVYANYDLFIAYEHGRDMAHKITFRYFDS